jgi:hypothetical protein
MYSALQGKKERKKGTDTDKERVHRQEMKV